MSIPAWWSGPFRLLDLPPELISKVFRFTDLIAPSEIRWYQSSGVRHTLHQCQRHCQTCTLAGSPDSCDCSLDDSILSTKDCLCWEPPTAIFLVNRQINDIANKTLFSKNHFVLFPEDPGDDSAGLAFLEFLDSLPTKGLIYIRSLEFRYWRTLLCSIHMRANHGLIGHACEVEWELLADFINENLDPTKLHIIVDSSLDAYVDAQSNRESLLLEYLTWTSYDRMVRCFGGLGLKSFHVYMSRAMVHHGHHVGAYSPHTEPDTIERRIQAEMAIERTVMGSSYDSHTESKYCSCAAKPLMHRPETLESRTWICPKHRALGFYCDDDKGYRPVFCIGSVRANPTA